MFDLDGTKLPLHPGNLIRHDWIETQWGMPQPVTVEVSPTQVCNQRCPFCAFDWVRGDRVRVLAQMSEELLKEVPDIPGTAVTWGGEGEPTLNKAWRRVVRDRKQPQGLITNGTWDGIKDLVPHFAWIRFSINAVEPETYGRLHGTNPMDLGKVLDNLKAACEVKDRTCTLGVQVLLFRENEEDVYRLWNMKKDLGYDYLVIKPFSQHPRRGAAGVPEEPTGQMLRNLSSFASAEDGFHFRRNAFSSKNVPKGYTGCLAAPYFHVVSATGHIYPCAGYMGDPKWEMGNLHYQTWLEFCTSRKRYEILKKLETYPVSACRHPCRLHESNLFMNRLRNPEPHDAFL